ncbi:MAG: succinate--CoA ligase subunit alpha [Infirmifilum sp.]
MGIIVDSKTFVLVQGITGRQGAMHTEEMLKYGTKVVAGVTPGKKGSLVHGVPVYDTVEDAVKNHPEINTSIIFVPAAAAPDAVYEAVDNGIKTVIVITEHIPVHETIRFVLYARNHGATLVGPNTPGVITPPSVKVGIMPGDYFIPGPVGLMSRSGTLTYEVSLQLAKRGLGVSTAVGIGGDPVSGISFEDAYLLFEKDPQTKVVVLIGEIGGYKEESFAKFYSSRPNRKPVVAFIAGKSAPPGKKMGHAGAIVYGKRGTYSTKVEALSEAGVKVAKTLAEIPELVKGLL